MAETNGVPAKKEREPALNVERLNQLMDEKGWGLGELEYQSKVKYDTLYKIRSAVRPRTSAEILAKIAQALGTSVDYLVGLTDNRHPYPVPPPVDEQTRLLQLAIERLSPRRRQEVAEIVRLFRQSDEDMAARFEQNVRLNKELYRVLTTFAGEAEGNRLLDLLLGQAGFDPARIRRLLDTEHNAKDVSEDE